MKTKRLLALLLFVSVVGTAFAEEAISSFPVDTPGVPVVVWNRTITVFHAPFEEFSPEERADSAVRRIEALSEFTTADDIVAKPATLGGYTGVVVGAEGKTLFGILVEDVDEAAGETLEGQVEKAVENLRAYLVAREEQLSLPLFLKGLGKAVVATLVFFLLMRGLVAFRRLVWRKIERGEIKHLAQDVKVGDVNLRPIIVNIQKGVVKTINLVVGLVAGYIWLGHVFHFFPYSRPWAEHLGNYLVNVADRIGSGVVAAVPGLFMVVVILYITRFVTRLVGGFFLSVERGYLKSDWLQPDTARATRRIIGALIWAFGLTVAYPYIPGSNSVAFKGVSVFFGLMMSLGSAGMINQIISGLVVVYSRAFQTGDFVRIGETEGVVSSVGLLSTKIATPKNEEVTVPNALLVSTPSWNFSSFGSGVGAALSTSVTIGYDTPWRQVHAILTEAAGKTRGVKTDPQPIVIQKSLSDFYVEYHLLVEPEDSRKRVLVLSELNANVQDTFNEYGVQIMSPHFRDKAAGPVVVPKEKWHEKPAKKDES